MFSASPLTMSAEPVSWISTSPRTVVSGPGTNSLATGTSLASPCATFSLAKAGTLDPIASSTPMLMMAIGLTTAPDAFIIPTSAGYAKTLALQSSLVNTQIDNVLLRSDYRAQEPVVSR